MPVHQAHRHVAVTLAFLQGEQGCGARGMDRSLSFPGLGNCVCSHLCVLCPVNLDFVAFMRNETAPRGALGAPQVQRWVICLGIPTLEGAGLAPSPGACD